MPAGHVTCVDVSIARLYVRSVRGEQNLPQVESPQDIRPDISTVTAEFLAFGAGREEARDAELLIRVVASSDLEARVAEGLADRIVRWVHAAREAA